jgi:DEAD/DEAH box helicase domain-containing protein
MWSFAEVLRRGCQDDLDVHPDELNVGLQPAHINGVATHRLFIADALENGAGYAPELGRPENLSAILTYVIDDVRGLAARYSSTAHGDCTESCPDCLRSYDNRRLHGALNWRLALDVATLAAAQPLDPARWLSRVAPLAQAFVHAYRVVPMLVQPMPHGLTAIVRRDHSAAVIVGHPLWRTEQRNLNDHQRSAITTLTDKGVGHVALSDAWTLQRAPHQIFRLIRTAP